MPGNQFVRFSSLDVFWRQFTSALYVRKRKKNANRRKKTLKILDNVFIAVYKHRLTLIDIVCQANFKLLFK